MQALAGMCNADLQINVRLTLPSIATIPVQTSAGCTRLAAREGVGRLAVLVSGRHRLVVGQWLGEVRGERARGVGLTGARSRAGVGLPDSWARRVDRYLGTCLELSFGGQCVAGLPKFWRRSRLQVQALHTAWRIDGDIVTFVILRPGEKTTCPTKRPP